MRKPKNKQSSTEQTQGDIGVLSEICGVSIVSKSQTDPDKTTEIYKMVLFGKDRQPISIRTGYEWRHKWYCTGARAKQMTLEFIQFISGITGKTFVATSDVNTSEMFAFVDVEYLKKMYGNEKVQEYEHKFLRICSSNYFYQIR